MIHIKGCGRSHIHDSDFYMDCASSHKRGNQAIMVVGHLGVHSELVNIVTQRIKQLTVQKKTENQ